MRGFININLSEINLSTLPEGPGIYIFSDKKHVALYVGKAKNLKARLRSYYGNKLLPKTKEMISKADHLSIIQVMSELESLLLEAKMVRKLDPFYNSALKDDKHPLYIKITKEKYPRILTVRKNDTLPSLALFGPFPNSTAIYSTLKMLRKIFPFSQHTIGHKACLYKQIKLCNPCPNDIENLENGEEILFQKRLYLTNIKSVKTILSGKFSRVIKDLKSEMDEYSTLNDYENAIRVREKIKRLDYLTQPINQIDEFIKNPNFAEDIINFELEHLHRILHNYIKVDKINRIECYDVAHLASSYPAASMVTFIGGVPEKKLYRHFKIRRNRGDNDISSLRKVAGRRLKYFKKWGKPDLVLVDGGKSQASAMNTIFSEYAIPVFGIAKREEMLVIPIKSFDKYRFQLIKASPPAKYLVQRIRNEAHRFARRYHHLLLSKALLQN
ncbi:hypothetical protein A3E41_02860 [Candidatus Woesebacteria bacterium RIFCSPHIGHO2_12_FULL_38_9]|nr:MAG: hypothetical protein A3E41_02860 [Candidatus Woesebacteria bacterium RIFCSPHIGHO2_12_FULL_38_9]